MTQSLPKPIAVLVGQNGNVFNLIGICSKALRRAGQACDNEEDKNYYLSQIEEMQKALYDCKSYDESLQLMMKYCDVE